MFYDKYATLCKEKNISVYKACVDLGLNRSAVAKWKAGAIPNGATLAKIGNYFGVTSDYLLGQEIKKEPATSSGSGPSANALLFDKLLKEQGIDPRKLTESEVRRMIAIHKTLSESQD